MNDRIQNGVKDELESITDQIEEGVRQGKYTLRELQDAALDKTKEAARATDEYVHDHPWTMVGVAAGVGLVIGLLLRRR
jgi:ElaB/YqjD/DUF883 family membrane-anchored ribosome-binding protein